MNPVKTNYFVYVLRSPKGYWYTGFTSNLERRLAEHSNKESAYTSHRGPYELIYYEACIDKADAVAREKYLKSGAGKRYLRNRMKQYLKQVFTG